MQWAALGLTVVSAQAHLVNAGEIKVWTTGAIAAVLTDVGPQFERTTPVSAIVERPLSGANKDCLGSEAEISLVRERPEAVIPVLT
jgi:hypothetical protein